MGHQLRQAQEPAVAPFQPSIDKQTSLLAGAVQAVARYGRVADAVTAHRDDNALLCLFPDEITRMAQFFLANFPGQVTYAMKCNPHPIVMRLLYDAGIRHFDVASWAEIKQVMALGHDAVAHFMHPVKSRAVIARAYAAGVRSFALDCTQELEKILSVIGTTNNLTLLLRLQCASEQAQMSMAGKFGASFAQACALWPRLCATGAKTGWSFHIGSQAMAPDAYRAIFALGARLRAHTGQAPDFIDVGGGFPLSYPQLEAPALKQYMQAIKDGAQAYGFAHTPLWSEPGRALVGGGGASVARVELRKGNMLYLNEGIFGSLFDAGAERWRFPAWRVGDTQAATGYQEFVLFGPTCDSHDRLHHPVRLPADMAEGDWIEFGQLGAYGQVMQTRFNGFWAQHLALIDEPPLLARPYGAALLE